MQSLTVIGEIPAKSLWVIARWESQKMTVVILTESLCCIPVCFADWPEYIHFLEFLAFTILYGEVHGATKHKSVGQIALKYLQTIDGVKTLVITRDQAAETEWSYNMMFIFYWVIVQSRSEIHVFHQLIQSYAPAANLHTFYIHFLLPLFGFFFIFLFLSQLIRFLDDI